VHANRIYVDLNDRAPYSRDSLDHLIGYIDHQIALRRRRNFPEKARVLADFQIARDILLRIRASGGLTSSGIPKDWTNDTTTAVIDPS
jgi:hypothetical protein